MENSSNPKTDDNKVLPKQLNYLKKKFKDYFFDFFMLFLAVTLGFFVNNLNENLSERNREKQYITSLMTDLRTDTAEIKMIHKSIASRIVGIDSLIHVLENRDKDNFINNLYYYSFKYLNSTEFHTSSDGTISQLKFAGGLRLIQKKGESDNIVHYYSSTENIGFYSEYCLKEFYKILDAEKEIFDLRLLRGHDINSFRNLKDLKLLIKEPLIIDHFYNQIMMYTGVLVSYNVLLNDLKKEAESLLTFTSKSYNIH
jgi:hypothetical protein